MSGTINIAKNVPNETPKGIEAIQNALITGNVKESPYTRVRFEAPNAVM